ncbi:uncharacterized protein ALTATR162_LOCUS1486 [Alternaria atra]|uniref:Uncharacterized protein n=1 Tax=Alternaria atra TaxID=119953 RepID=A0A8J2HZ00_9PLEO|nr:uncharacterized protein ALTATR162_LOCUS1486 [Alternaria atra]CAG5144126.1 unnamed protein product [Alternaria atra]
MEIVQVNPASGPGTRKPRPVLVPIMLPDGLARSAYSEKTIATFLSMYNPQGVVHATNTDAKEFVNLLPLLSTRDKALQMAALAVGITQLGITSNNENLTRQGRTLYGKALKETAVALQYPARASSESLLVVPRVMALFDMLFGAEPNTTNQAKSWLSHCEGELAMVVSRGPEIFAENDVAHLLFTNARYRLLGPATRARKPTILNEEKWKTIPWKGRIKTSDDILIDILCGIPELLEAVDKLQFQCMSEQEKEGLQVYTIARCWTLHFELEAWVSTKANAIYTPEIVNNLTPINFPNIDIACVSVRYWLTALFIYSSLDIANGIDPSTDTLLSHPDRPHPRPFARMIMKSIDYFVQEQFGVTGIMALWMPLGNALFYLNRNREPDEEYIMSTMKIWHKPRLPSAMREFLKSFRHTVDMKTLIARPLSEL